MLASVVFHSKDEESFLQKTLHMDHPLWASRLFSECLVDELAPLVRVGVIIDTETQVKASKGECVNKDFDVLAGWSDQSLLQANGMASTSNAADAADAATAATATAASAATAANDSSANAATSVAVTSVPVTSVAVTSVATNAGPAANAGSVADNAGSATWGGHPMAEVTEEASHPMIATGLPPTTITFWQNNQVCTHCTTVKAVPLWRPPDHLRMVPCPAAAPQMRRALLQLSMNVRTALNPKNLRESMKKAASDAIEASGYPHLLSPLHTSFFSARPAVCRRRQAFTPSAAATTADSDVVATCSIAGSADLLLASTGIASRSREVQGGDDEDSHTGGSEWRPERTANGHGAGEPPRRGAAGRGAAAPGRLDSMAPQAQAVEKAS